MDENEVSLPKEILDALAKYLKDEAIKFYQSDDGKKVYEDYHKEKILKDVNDTNDKSVV